MRRPRFLYFARIDHPNEAVYAENVLDYCAEVGISARELVMKSNGAYRPELKDCLADAGVILSPIWHLDHSHVGDAVFLDIAAEAGVPVIQWILDHPSARWPEFAHSTAANSRFVFLSAYSQAYFLRYALPDSRTAWTAGVGPNRNSRIDKLTRTAYLARDIPCLLPLNVRRISGTSEELQQRLAALPDHLRAPVTKAAEKAYHDLQGPIEPHFFSAAMSIQLFKEHNLFHRCIQIIEDMVQIRRRFKLFEIARRFPVLFQSDILSRYIPDAGLAKLEEGVSMVETLRRMRRCKAVVSLTHVNDEIHDRVLNGLNAGALCIVLELTQTQTGFEAQ